MKACCKVNGSETKKRNLSVVILSENSMRKLFKIKQVSYFETKQGFCIFLTVQEESTEQELQQLSKGLTTNQSLSLVHIATFKDFRRGDQSTYDSDFRLQCKEL